jgi:putative FmdB family regulatory protein
MPVYEYRCEVCGERFDRLVRTAGLDESVTCPRCGATETRRQWSVFSALGLEREPGRRSGCTLSNPSG